MPVIEPFEVVFVEDGAFAVSLSTAETIAVDMGVIQRTGYEPVFYHGDYEATPSAEAQTFHTKSKMMEHDFIVNPIPSNYGLITWNGSTLTVS